MDGNAAADEVAAGDGVGDMLFHNERGFAKVKGDVRFVVRVGAYRKNLGELWSGEERCD